MNDNRNHKEFNAPKKRTYSKSSSSSSRFGGKKNYTSKSSSSEKGEYAKKSSEYLTKKSYNKYDSSTSDKEYKGKKYGNDKPYTNDDSNINKSADSKYNKPYKDKKPYNRDEKTYGNKNKYEKKPYKSDKPGEYRSENKSESSYNKEKPFYKKFYKKDNDVDTEKSYSKPYEKKESSYSNDRYSKNDGTFKKKLIKKGSNSESDSNETYSKPYEKKESSYSNERYSKNESTFKKKLIKKGSHNESDIKETYSKSYDREESADTNNEYGSEQSSFRKKLTKKASPFEQDIENNNEKRTSYTDNSEGEEKIVNEKKFYSATEKSVKTITPHKASDDGAIRLNKYIATSGICSRREADELITSGAVSVNGKVVTEMGVKVLPTDVISYGGETLRNEKNVYLLLNKPKDFITTSDDPFNRKTVMSLVHRACKERIYPVGRLDRMTTGLLLFTNDGEMAKKLTHPKHNIKKIYQVELDKALTKADMIEITKGVELEDGVATVDVITYVGEGADKKTLGLELHSGKNRIVRRIFEHFGYNVVKLDRVYFAGLTKKDLPRGRHRFLTDIEINMLKIVS